MKFVPHEYQQYAIDFIKKNEVAAVFLDMGLGKTVITLTALNDLLFDSFEIAKVLVIGPLRVSQNTWPSEIKKWEHLSHLRYSVAVGTEAERISALKADTGFSPSVSFEEGIRRTKDWIIQNDVYQIK